MSKRLGCEVFTFSESCYRYAGKSIALNEEIGKWLLRLTGNNHNSGFGLCYQHLRNARGFRWNHKRIYWIYREFELNLRIKPRKRMVRD